MGRRVRPNAILTVTILRFFWHYAAGVWYAGRAFTIYNYHTSYACACKISQLSPQGYQVKQKAFGLNIFLQQLGERPVTMSITLPRKHY